MFFNLSKIRVLALAVFALFLFCPISVKATEDGGFDYTSDSSTTLSAKTDYGITFKAKVLEVENEKILERADGSKSTQQDLLLRGLEGQWKDKEFEYKGIAGYDVVSNNTYKAGDKVFVSYLKNQDGTEEYFVSDFVRTNYLIFLFILFCAITIFVGKKKGLKSLLSLFLSFFIIVKIMVPRFLAGGNPLLIGVLGCFGILAIIIYLTEGFNRKSHLAMVSVLISLTITFLLAQFFSSLMRLTGFAQEESMFLLGVNNGQIDFRGLLLAGILIGAAGVLDDIVVGQIEAVNQIKAISPDLSFWKTYKAAYEIGNTHLGAIVNTLFLTYAGASLSVLLLFYLNPAGSVSFAQVINNESIATEIVRTLVGSIGIVLSMPITTFLAVWQIKTAKN